MKISGQLNGVDVEPTCIYCESKLKPAPTELGWVKKDRLSGICFDCIESLNKTMLSIKAMHPEELLKPKVAKEPAHTTCEGCLKDNGSLTCGNCIMPNGEHKNYTYVLKNQDGETCDGDCEPCGACERAVSDAPVPPPAHTSCVGCKDEYDTDYAVNCRTCHDFDYVVARRMNYTPAPQVELQPCLDIRKIIKSYLRANGFDGLFNTDNPCGCKTNDLCPCDGDMMDCRPGYLVDCDKNDDCGCEGQGTAHWHIETKKPPAPQDTGVVHRSCKGCDYEKGQHLNPCNSCCADDGERKNYTAPQPAPHVTCYGCSRAIHDNMETWLLANWSKADSKCTHCYSPSQPDLEGRKNYTPAPQPAPYVPTYSSANPVASNSLCYNKVCTDCCSKDCSTGFVAKQPAPKVTDDGWDNSIEGLKAQSKAWRDTYNLCKYMGMSVLSSSIGPALVKDFIRSLAQRAGEERYSAEQVRQWIGGKLIVTLSCHDEEVGRFNSIVNGIADEVFDPQSGIKAVTERKGG